MTAHIFIVHDEQDILACFPAFLALRPHVALEDFVAQIRRQQSQGYRILALRTGIGVQAVAGFRCAEFLAWGKILYIDDLSTLPEARRQGFAAALLDWLQAYATDQRCKAIHLDSGYTRHSAHSLYLSKGYLLTSHHFALELKPT